MIFIKSVFNKNTTFIWKVCIERMVLFPKATVYVADNLFISMLKYSSFYAYSTPNHMYIYLYTSKSFSQLWYLHVVSE